MADSLFACTKCHHKFPFAKLSGSLMQCSGCQAESSKLMGPAVCTYCREEFTGGDDSICSKCRANVKQYGKPRACEICNVIAAFIGSKCKRCVVSENKWGSPVICEQCKQKCAFNRDEHSKRKVDHKVLCWLCTIAYKRVLSKARRKDSSSSSMFSSSQSQSHKRKSDPITTASREHTSRSSKHNVSSSSSSIKRSKPSQNLNGTASTQSTESVSSSYMHDMNIVLVTQLREEVESLKKTLALKDKELLDKERKMTEFKTAKMETDKAHRDKIVTMQTNHHNVVESLQQKNNDLLKQISTLSKATKRNLGGAAPGSNNGSPASRY